MLHLVVNVSITKFLTDFECSVTFTGQQVTLPSATIRPFSSVFVVSTNYNLLLSCTGVGTLSWYRGNRLGEPVSDMTTHLIQNNTLVLNMSGLVEGVDATYEGLPYFCLASNSVGVARSRTVLVQYACKWMVG